MTIQPREKAGQTPNIRQSNDCRNADELMTAVCQFADLLDVKAGIQPPPTLKAVERSA